MHRFGKPVLMVVGLACPAVAIPQDAPLVVDGTTGTFAPEGPPSRSPVRTSAGDGCIVELTQTYTVSGTLQGFFGVDYRILVEGPCGEPPGAFNEEWIAVGTFDGTFQERQATGVFSYTARVSAGGDVDGRIVFGQGLAGTLTVRGNLGQDGLSYVGSIAPEEHQQPTSVRLLHQRYMTASLRHDLATLRRLTREDVVWQLGPRTFRGRDEVLGPNEYDAGIGNQLQYRNVVVRGDTVETELIERNDLIRAVGMAEVRGFPRYVFEDGLLVRKEPWRASEDLAELQARTDPLRRWIRTHHPEALEILVHEPGRLRFSRASGELMARLAREWDEAGAPGRSPPR
jgi:hypothetical protein